MSKCLILRVFVICFALFVELFAQIQWKEIRHFSLSKDQIATIDFHPKNKNLQSFRFDFRWTLYDTNQVIMISHFKKFPYQHVLFFDNRLNTFKLILYPNFQRDYDGESYLLLKMNQYNKHSKTIDFDVYVRDKYDIFEKTKK